MFFLIREVPEVCQRVQIVPEIAVVTSIYSMVTRRGVPVFLNALDARSRPVCYKLEIGQLLDLGAVHYKTHWRVATLNIPMMIVGCQSGLRPSGKATCNSLPSVESRRWCKCDDRRCDPTWPAKLRCSPDQDGTR